MKIKYLSPTYKEIKRKDIIKANMFDITVRGKTTVITSVGIEKLDIKLEELKEEYPLAERIDVRIADFDVDRAYGPWGEA